jgi:hypothetical protein
MEFLTDNDYLRPFLKGTHGDFAARSSSRKSLRHTHCTSIAKLYQLHSRWDLNLLKDFAISNLKLHLFVFFVVKQ